MVKGTCICADTGGDIVANLMTPGAGGGGETKTGFDSIPTPEVVPKNCSILENKPCEFEDGECIWCFKKGPNNVGGRRRKSYRKKSRRKRTRRKKRRRKKKRRKTRKGVRSRASQPPRRKTRRKRRVHKKYR